MKNIISYESCKWYVKVWRQRWYLYAIFLHIKNNYILPIIGLEFILGGLDDDTEKKLRIKWLDIKHHVELSKMYKFSSRHERQD